MSLMLVRMVEMCMLLMIINMRKMAMIIIYDTDENDDDDTDENDDGENDENDDDWSCGVSWLWRSME